MGGNGNRDVGKNENGNEVLDWEWDLDGNGNDSTGMGGNRNNNSHSGTPLIHFPCNMRNLLKSGGEGRFKVSF